MNPNMQKSRVLIVATTADYIDDINKNFLGDVFFLTDLKERAESEYESPTTQTELCLELTNPLEVYLQLDKHLKEENINLNGITCFDCESLWLTAFLAKHFSLPFHSTTFIEKARSKYHSKELWRKAGVTTPQSKLIYTIDDVLEFLKTCGGDMVLKPLAGSGSEFVYRVKNKEMCEMVYDQMKRQIPLHSNQRMYTTERLPDQIDGTKVFCAEEFIHGNEYSCDAVLHDGAIKIIRLTKKIPTFNGDFGTIAGYQMLNKFPTELPERELSVLLKAASQRLGFYSVWFMADIKVFNKQIFIFELTPRPGGDCLPPLIQASSGFDIFNAILNFSRRIKVNFPKLEDYQSLVGLQLYATSSGKIVSLDDKALNQHDKVKHVSLYRKKGDIIKLPPEDYSTHRLGFVIFKPDSVVPIPLQCQELSKNLHVSIEGINEKQFVIR